MSCPLQKHRRFGRLGLAHGLAGIALLLRLRLLILPGLILHLLHQLGGYRLLRTGGRPLLRRYRRLHRLLCTKRCTGITVQRLLRKRKTALHGHILLHKGVSALHGHTRLNKGIAPLHRHARLGKRSAALHGLAAKRRHGVWLPRLIHILKRILLHNRCLLPV